MIREVKVRIGNVKTILVYPDPYKCHKCDNTLWMIKTLIPFGNHHNTILQCSECNNLRQVINTDKGGSMITEFRYVDRIRNVIISGG